MERHHPVLWKCMETVNKTYEGKSRIEVGPNLVSRSIIEHFQIKPKNLAELDNPLLSVLPAEIFYPFVDLNLYGLWEDQSGI